MNDEGQRKRECLDWAAGGPMPQEQLAKFDSVFERYPDLAMRRDAIAGWAQAHGGQTLAFWQLKWGPYFGLPSLRSVQDVSARLGISTDVGLAIYRAGNAYADAELAGNAEYTRAREERVSLMMSATEIADERAEQSDNFSSDSGP